MSRGRGMPRRQGWRLEPACMRGASPVLIYRACQLVGLLIRRRDEIFVASRIEHVGVALTRPSSGGGSWTATRCLCHASAVRPVFTF